MKYALDRKPLNDQPKEPAQKYLILLSNQIVIVDTEFKAMKEYVGIKRIMPNARIVEMLPTSSDMLPQINGLSALLENLELNRQINETKVNTKKKIKRENG